MKVEKLTLEEQINSCLSISVSSPHLCTVMGNVIDSLKELKSYREVHNDSYRALKESLLSTEEEY